MTTVKLFILGVQPFHSTSLYGKEDGRSKVKKLRKEDNDLK